eukprot:scaffold109952_cov105-Cyclotella_meneghiniana.AAC.1
MAFDAFGKLAASLPVEVTMNGVTQRLAIKFEDDNLFDTQKLLVKIDIPVCSVLPVVNGLLGKLGSLGLSPRSILGNVDMSGLGLGDTLDDYFPNVDSFIDGILEEAVQTGDVGPMLEDLITMMIEDVLDFDNVEGCTERRRALREARSHHAVRNSGSRNSDHRGRRHLRKTHPAARALRRLAPRAQHLPYNHFTRPRRRRHLQAECFNTELLDGLSIKGGYDGTKIFFNIDLDVSRRVIEESREVVLKPLEFLSQTELLQSLNLGNNDGGL